MSATIYVEIGEFPEEGVLEAAFHILERLLRDKPDDEDIPKFRRLLSAPVIDEDNLPPPSTAAKIATRADLA